MKINNHYVPRTYLKQWAHKKNVYEHSFLVPHPDYPEWRRVSISSTSSLDYLYLYHAEEGITDEMEDFFSEEFEMQYNSFICKINDNLPLNEKDKEYISKLVASQHLRTLKGFYRSQKHIIDKFPIIVDETMVNMKEEFKTTGTLSVKNKSIPDNHKLIPLKIEINKLDDDHSILNVQSIAGKSMWLFAIKHLLSSTYKVLNNISWCIYDAPENFDWVTSDDPVIFLNFFDKDNYNFGGGWGVDHTNIIFPLSPTKLLFAEIGVSTVLYQKATLPFAEEIQRYIVENAHNKIYSRNHIPNITNIRKRRVDEMEFKEFINSLNSFHENYLKHEIPYFKDIL